MKKLYFLAASAAFVLAFECCENKTAKTGIYSNAGEQAAGDNTALPPGKSDSLAGFEGCERAAWSPLTTNSDEFLYQHYIVKITRNPDSPGETVTVQRRDTASPDFNIPMPDAGHFYGICRGKLFVDAGTGPDSREVYIFDLNRRVQLYSTRYCGDPRVIESEKLWYLIPVEEQEVTKMPECPDRAEWEKNGLKVGYGQRAIFNFEKRSLTRKSEWACVPLQ